MASYCSKFYPAVAHKQVGAPWCLPGAPQATPPWLLLAKFTLWWPTNREATLVWFLLLLLNLTRAWPTKTGATLVWLLLALKFSRRWPHQKQRSYVGMASYCSKFYPPVAPPTTHRGAALVWLPFPLKLTLGRPTKKNATLIWLLLAHQKQGSYVGMHSSCCKLLCLAPPQTGEHVDMASSCSKLFPPVAPPQTGELRWYGFLLP